jgi:hypothetical protein
MVHSGRWPHRFVSENTHRCPVSPRLFANYAQLFTLSARSAAKTVMRFAIVLLPKKYQFKISDSCADQWDHAHLEGGATPWGAWGQAVAARGGRRNCARDWRGAERPRKRRNPRKARFFAEQKMRPNNTLQGDALIRTICG